MDSLNVRPSKTSVTYGHTATTNDTSEKSRGNAERTSTACWLRKYDYETSQTTAEEPQMIEYEDRFAFVETEKKISNITNLPISHQEPLQIVRYFPGAISEPNAISTEPFKSNSSAALYPPPNA